MSLFLLYHKFSVPDATASFPALHIPLISENDLIHDKTPSRVSYPAGCHIIELASEPHRQQAQRT